MSTRTGPSRSRKSSLTTAQHYRLNEACQVVRRAFDGHGPYLVGTVIGGRDYRDVDVRTILPDEEFDAVFAGRERLWDLLCLSVSQYLTDVTGLPVDFQVQRMTEANAKHDGPRNALGLHVDEARRFAGGGDATPSQSDRTCEDGSLARCGLPACEMGCICPSASDRSREAPDA